MRDRFNLHDLYSNEEIFRSLRVGNTGGVRVTTTPNGQVERLVIFTSMPSARQLAENPYHDRLEGDVLIYTGTGRAGDQFVSGLNTRITQQQADRFPIYGFIQKSSRRDLSMGNKRWAFLGLLEYLRCYRERQIDSQGILRNVWIFELRVHSDPSNVATAESKHITSIIMQRSAINTPLEDREVVGTESLDQAENHL